ncbi:exodeoxyribonuclease III [Legionella micdadei]|uniref:Exodeoxyribonuclease n=1 Tax=Legionella micdadei TaxID=451 RepID=A0A098GB78_LEGMI|nr:exodeoxyribonuclease III [Legionella micdadei]ARG98813.1 exodeoxyribonuclease III [Legionella micdadei]ARH01532.1 exodeoxyribonuclease III [Legionella micdadei]KTD27843.1 exodeoxyribonuclease [Legionella micdadei]NSL19555.1 exodeoxyribonuclease III [Legionella micdadei]CEG59748.1 Exodeoxyribonuclease [Legionella micdadei]
MKIISFNANGVRSASRNGFYDWLKEQNADFVCLQETKVQDSQLTLNEVFYPAGYFCEYYHAQKKGYSGVAIYARQPPKKVIKGLGFDSCDNEGRYLQFDYPKLSVVSVYLPSGTSGEVRQQVKFDFLERFEKHLLSLKNEGRELILCGDYNIAHKQIDLKNWRSNQKNSGFLPEERAWMDKLFGPMGFFDAFRLLNQEEGQYTWWTYRSPSARDKNIGWRIDYQVITPGLIDSVKKVSIATEGRWSDHAPLIIEYEGDWCA